MANRNLIRGQTRPVLDNDGYVSATMQITEISAKDAKFGNKPKIGISFIVEGTRGTVLIDEQIGAYLSTRKYEDPDLNDEKRLPKLTEICLSLGFITDEDIPDLDDIGDEVLTEVNEKLDEVDGSNVKLKLIQKANGYYKPDYRTIQA